MREATLAPEALTVTGVLWRDAAGLGEIASDVVVPTDEIQAGPDKVLPGEVIKTDSSDDPAGSVIEAVDNGTITGEGEEKEWKAPGVLVAAGTVVGLAAVALALGWGSGKSSKQEQAAREARTRADKAKKGGANNAGELDEKARRLADIAEQHRKAKEYQVLLAQQQAERDRRLKMGQAHTSKGAPGSPHYENSGW